MVRLANGKGTGMSVDEGLVERIRAVIDVSGGLVEKRMFGGLAFLLHGNMALGVIGSDLIVRVGADAYSAALEESGARPFDMTGRPMRGWVVVGPEATTEDGELERWLARGVAHAASLPPKAP